MAGMLQMRRSRGAASGFLLVLLGIWGAIIPFIGPYFHYAYTPDTNWTYTTARLWLEILPGAAVFLGGVLLMIATGRHIALFGADPGRGGRGVVRPGHRAQPAVEHGRRHPGRDAGRLHHAHADHGAGRLLHGPRGRGHLLCRHGDRPDLGRFARAQGGRGRPGEHGPISAEPTEVLPVRNGPG